MIKRYRCTVKNESFCILFINCNKVKEGANEFRNISKIVFRIKGSLDTALSATNAGKRYQSCRCKNGIATGEIIEDYPEDYPNPSCLIFGYNVNGRILHIVAGCDNIIYIS